jgi:hypothetical protein
MPVQLVVQQVQIRGGPDCLAMFDNGSQTTLVLNSYAKEAKMKKIGDSRIRVRGICNITLRKEVTIQNSDQPFGLDNK